MGRRWLLPALLLVILLVAFVSRWEDLGTRTEDAKRATYLHDRWAGRVWVKYSGVSGGQLIAGETLAAHNLHNPWTKPLDSRNKEANILYARRERAIWTGAWVVLVLANAYWLYASLKRSRASQQAASSGVAE